MIELAQPRIREALGDAARPLYLGRPDVAIRRAERLLSESYERGLPMVTGLPSGCSRPRFSTLNGDGEGCLEGVFDSESRATSFFGTI